MSQARPKSHFAKSEGRDESPLLLHPRSEYRGNNIVHETWGIIVKRTKSQLSSLALSTYEKKTYFFLVFIYLLGFYICNQLFLIKMLNMCCCFHQFLL